MNKRTSQFYTFTNKNELKICHKLASLDLRTVLTCCIFPYYPYSYLQHPLTLINKSMKYIEKVPDPYFEFGYFE